MRQSDDTKELYTSDLQILVATATWNPGFVNPWGKEIQKGFPLINQLINLKKNTRFQLINLNQGDHRVQYVIAEELCSPPRQTFRSPADASASCCFFRCGLCSVTCFASGRYTSSVRSSNDNPVTSIQNRSSAQTAQGSSAPQNLQR